MNIVMSVNIEQINAMLERAGKTNLLQKQKVDLDKERIQLVEENIKELKQLRFRLLAEAGKIKNRIYELTGEELQ